MKSEIKEKPFINKQEHESGEDTKGNEKNEERIRIDNGGGGKREKKEKRNNQWIGNAR